MKDNCIFVWAKTLSWICSWEYWWSVTCWDLSFKSNGSDLSQYVFATELHCYTENLYCANGLLSSVCAANTSAVQTVMRRLMLLSTALRKELTVFSLVAGFTWEIILVGGHVCLSPEQTVCTAVIWLSQRSDSPFWCSKIKKIRNNWTAWGLNSQSKTHSTHRRMSVRLLWWLQTLNHPTMCRSWFMLPTLYPLKKKTTHTVYKQRQIPFQNYMVLLYYFSMSCSTTL